jgi:hypothetical protein
MFKEIQAGKLIVINMKAGDQLYGKFWIEQVNACMGKRYNLPTQERTPTTFIMDEAQTWVIGQITNVQVKGSIYTNTTLKFTAKTSEDIYALCRSMGQTEHEFISTLNRFEFAYFGADMDTAIKVKFPLVEFDKMPQMTKEQYDELRGANRLQYAYTAKPVPPPAAEPP